MKKLGLTLVVAISLASGLIAGEISSDHLIEGFITYTQKAENPKVDEQKTDRMRKALKQSKEHPLLAPYVFEGKKCDRAPLVKAIHKNIQKWNKSDVPLSKTSSFASDSKNLASLSDAELVIA